MRYRVRHSTRYDYDRSVVHAHHLAHLRPRPFARQQVEDAEIRLEPEALSRYEFTDYFGNLVDRFEVFGAHDTLDVVSTSTVTVAPNPFADSTPLLDMSWEKGVAWLDANSTLPEIQEFRGASPLIRAHPSLREYGEASLRNRRPLALSVVELCARIHRDFEYAVDATDVSTPLIQVMETRRGVCQDFAHLAVGCLRSVGLAARYVSGYLETIAPPGKPRLIGADASHAWASVYLPEVGWFDFDPTNDMLPSERHITVAWGRDFSDVSPLKGVVLGGGGHRVSVGVDVERIDPN